MDSAAAVHAQHITRADGVGPVAEADDPRFIAVQVVFSLRAGEASVPVRGVQPYERDQSRSPEYVAHEHIVRPASDGAGERSANRATRPEAPVLTMRPLLVVCCLGFWIASLAAQESGGLVVEPVRDNIYLLAGAGANITVSAGEDGVVVVDAGGTQRSADVIPAVQRLFRDVLSKRAPSDRDAPTRF